MYNMKLFIGKIIGSETGYKELDFAIGSLVEEIKTGKSYIVDLSHHDENTKFDDIAIEVISETVEEYHDNL